MCPQQFTKLVLVDAAGFKPPEGEIFDIFQVVAKAFITRSILNPETTPEFQQICPDEPDPEQADLWDIAREASCRLSWKPYMYNPSLPHVLPRLKRLPTLIVWGDQDPIVPVSSGRAYQEAIPGSRLEVISNCGHRPEVEQTEEFLRVVGEFLA